MGDVRHGRGSIASNDDAKATLQECKVFCKRSSEAGGDDG